MFRAIEAVYRINKILLAVRSIPCLVPLWPSAHMSYPQKLNEIGPNPSSPKALGDLLMRWISDIEPAYTRYATTISLDFDSYDPVQSNSKLAPILGSLPWPSSLPSPPSGGDAVVTMDRLFELPFYRVRYYQRLYAKLLRSTQEGRSDHALLVSANEKLAKLEELCEEGRNRSVLGPGGKEELLRRRAEEAERVQRAQEQVAQERVAQAPAQSPVLEQRRPAEAVERFASPPNERREVEQPARAGPPRLNLDLAAAATTLRKEEQQRSAVESPRMESPSSRCVCVVIAPRCSTLTAVPRPTAAASGRPERPASQQPIPRRYTPPRRIFLESRPCV